MANKNKENCRSKVSIIVMVLVGIIISAAIGAGSLLLVLKLNPDWATQKITNVTKTEKEVTVTDEGISDAVDKLYDSTVIVEIGTSKDNIEGWGSGVVYKTDEVYGYILTNHHVVEDASYINIVFSDGSETEGTLVGSDQYADIGVVKVPINSIIEKAEIGSSDELELGDTVFAIGTPISLNYKFTVTRGILSGKDRMVAASSSSGNSTDAWYMNLLQIDATINSGNSGGPLANSNGEVVGITNSKLSSSGYSNSASIENMGFAIPIEVAVNVADQLIDSGKVERPLLGVSMASSLSAAKMNGINVDDSLTYGAVIAAVEDGSAADKAGLKKGDVIISFDGNKVENYMYVKYYLYRHKVGDTVTIEYNRNGEVHTAEVKLSN